MFVVVVVLIRELKSQCIEATGGHLILQQRLAVASDSAGPGTGELM